jgi:hypothetical protein
MAGICSEICIIRQFCYLANVIECNYTHLGSIYSLLHTYFIWYSLLLLGYTPVQHVIVLNTVGSCNTVVL